MTVEVEGGPAAQAYRNLIESIGDPTVSGHKVLSVAIENQIETVSDPEGFTKSRETGLRTIVITLQGPKKRETWVDF